MLSNSKTSTEPDGMAPDLSGLRGQETHSCNAIDVAPRLPPGDSYAGWEDKQRHLNPNEISAICRCEWHSLMLLVVPGCLPWKLVCSSRHSILRFCCDSSTVVAAACH